MYAANAATSNPSPTRKAHCGCGGLWNLDYQPPKFDLGEIDTHEWSQFRYRNFMALDGDVWRTVTMGEGMTPSSAWTRMCC